MTLAFQDLWALFRLRFRLLSRWSLSRYTRGAARAAPFKLLAVLAFALVIVPAATTGAAGMVRLALQGQAPGPIILPALTWGLSGAMVAVFFYSMLALVATLTSRGDLSLLLLSPLSPRLILTDRLLSVAGGSSLLLLVIGLPVLLAAGQVLEGGWPFLAVAVCLVLILPILPTAAAMLLVLVVIRWLPAGKARAASSILGLAAATVFYIGSQNLGGSALHLPASLLRTQGSWSLLPTSWPGHALQAANASDPAGAIGYIMALLVLSLLAAGIAVECAAGLLATGVTTYQEVGTARSLTPSPSPMGRRGAGGEAAEVGAPLRHAASALREVGGEGRPSWLPIVYKEWLSWRRDPKLLVQLVYPLLIEGYSFYRTFGLSIAAHPGLQGKVALLFTSSLYLTVTLTALFLLSILALPALNREGQALYLLALAPLRARDILMAKWLACALPVLALDTALLALSVPLLHLDPLQTLIDGLAIDALIVALTGGLVCVGLIWSRIVTEGSRRLIHPMALLVGPTCGVVLCMEVGIQLRYLFAMWDQDTQAAIGAGLGIALVTGSVCAVCLWIGPGLLTRLLTSEKKPA